MNAPKAVHKVAASAARQINAVVVSAGLMAKTVKVRVGAQKWDGHIRKVYLFFFSSFRFSQINSFQDLSFEPIQYQILRKNTANDI